VLAASVIHPSPKSFETSYRMLYSRMDITLPLLPRM
jgi:hypothetical protein